MSFEEEWRPVRGYEGLYEVSSFGRVKSLDRTTMRKNGKPLPIKERIIKPARTKTGYERCVLWDGERGRNISVHTLVLNSFCGEKPDGMWARHLNNIPYDNRVWNICWDTPKNNISDRWKYGTEVVGSRCPGSRLTEEKVVAIRTLYKKTQCSAADLAQLFDVNRSSIFKIVNGESWAWLGA